MKTESFETTKGKVYGDLLSRKGKDKELKIGLLPGAYFEYFRMWGETYEKQIRGDVEVVADELRRKFLKVVCSPGLCDTVDKCNEAGKLFRKEELPFIADLMGMNKRVI